MVDTGKYTDPAERERRRQQRIRRENDPQVIALRRMIRIQRNRMEADGEAAKVLQQRIVSLKRRLFRRMREIA